MTKYTEQQVREAAEWNRQNRVTSKEAEMLTAYADLMAAQPVAVPDGWREVVREYLEAEKPLFQSGGFVNKTPSHEQRTRYMAARDAMHAMLAAAPSPAAEGAKVGDCTCPSGDGSLRWPCPAHPAQPAEVLSDEQIDAFLPQEPSEAMYCCSDARVIYVEDYRTAVRAAIKTAATSRHAFPQIDAAVLLDLAEPLRPLLKDSEDWGLVLEYARSVIKCAVLAQPSGGGERAAFEAAILKIAARNEYRFMDSLLKRSADSGDYSTTWVDSAWIGWQARAAIAAARGE